MDGANSSDSRRTVIHVTCSTHGGARDFANLVVSKRDGEILMDPHVTGSCVLIFGEAAASQLFDVLAKWSG
jgi:hypothetical protein